MNTCSRSCGWEKEDIFWRNNDGGDVGGDATMQRCILCQRTKTQPDSFLCDPNTPPHTPTATATLTWGMVGQAVKRLTPSRISGSASTLREPYATPAAEATVGRVSARQRKDRQHVAKRHA